jgi:hypothetical protein
VAVDEARRGRGLKLPVPYHRPAGVRPRVLSGDCGHGGYICRTRAAAGTGCPTRCAALLAMRPVAVCPRSCSPSPHWGGGG